MTLRPLALLTLAALALTAPILTGCGKQAELERPAPMWDAQKTACSGLHRGISE